MGGYQKEARSVRLLGYTRLSVAQDKDKGNGKAYSDSLDAQADAIKAWCKEHGHRLVDTQPDDGRSGTLDEGGRTGLAAALNQLEAGQADGLVVHRLDRLARALHVQEAILAKVWALDGHVFSTVEGEVLRDDPDDPMRTFVRQVMGAAAQLERGIVVARMQGGRKRRKRQGGYIGGDVPYGYRLGEDGQLVPVPDQQHVISYVTGLRTRGWTYQKIADKLNRPTKRNPKVVPGPSGGKWYPMTLQRIIARSNKAER